MCKLHEYVHVSIHQSVIICRAMYIWPRRHIITKLITRWLYCITADWLETDSVYMWPVIIIGFQFNNVSYVKFQQRLPDGKLCTKFRFWRKKNWTRAWTIGLTYQRTTNWGNFSKYFFFKKYLLCKSIKLGENSNEQNKPWYDSGVSELVESSKVSYVKFQHSVSDENIFDNLLRNNFSATALDLEKV